VNLYGASDGISLAEPYVPSSPDLSVVEFTSQTLRDGGELQALTRRNVVERVSLLVLGASTADLQGNFEDLELLLRQAERRQTLGVGDRVYLEYRPGASGDVWRSEILYGRFEPERDTASVAHWAEAAVRFNGVIRRRFYWEGTIANAPLSNANGTDETAITGGLQIDNANDSTHDNTASIDGADITGNLPTPAVIRMKNDNTSTALTDFYIGHNVFGDQNLNPILEGEDASAVAGGAAPTTDANSSNGEYQVATVASSDALLMSWTISAVMAGYLANRYFRLIARLPSYTTGMRIRATIALSSSDEFTTPTTVITSQLADIGVLRLPPFRYGSYGVAYNGFKLRLYGSVSGGGSISVDFLQLTAMDSYMHLEPIGTNTLGSNAVLFDDGIDDLTYEADTLGSSVVASYLPRGGHVGLIPGEDQTLYFLTNYTSGLPDIDHTLNVFATYRPRRLTV